jgi:hypothetical protein
LWEETEKAVEIAINQFGSTKANPYFLVLKARVFIEQNNMEQGMLYLEKGVAAMSSAASIDKLFLTETALLRLSMNDEAQREKGLQELQTLAADAKNIHAAYAQYKLAQYYERSSMLDKAKEMYRVLADSIKNEESLFVSPYALNARDQLKRLAA